MNTIHPNNPNTNDYINIILKNQIKFFQPNGFAVMVWIHGGGYAVHTAAKYGDYGICK